LPTDFELRCLEYDDEVEKMLIRRYFEDADEEVQCESLNGIDKMKNKICRSECQVKHCQGLDDH